MIWALYIPPTSPHQNDKEEESPPTNKETETVTSATELMDMDITKLSEMEFRVTMIQMMCRLENSINEMLMRI